MKLQIREYNYLITCVKMYSVMALHIHKDNQPSETFMLCFLCPTIQYNTIFKFLVIFRFCCYNLISYLWLYLFYNVKNFIQLIHIWTLSLYFPNNNSKLSINSFSLPHPDPLYSVLFEGFLSNLWVIFYFTWAVTITVAAQLQTYRTRNFHLRCSFLREMLYPIYNFSVWFQ